MPRERADLTHARTRIRTRARAVRPGDPPAVDTPALESFLAHVERNVAQRKNDDELMLCVKDPSGGGLSMLRVTMTFKPPPPPAPAVMPAPPGIEGEADEEDFDFDVDKVRACGRVSVSV